MAAVQAPIPEYIDVSKRIRHRAPLQTRRLDQITNQVVHYEAGGFVSPDLTLAEEIEHILSVAHFHKYQRTFDGAGKLYGRTLEYTFGIAPSGRRFLLNDPRFITWSHKNGNLIAVSTLLMLGVGQAPTPAMLASLYEHLDYTASRPDMNVDRRRTWGHRETGPKGPGPNWLNTTSCPGEALDEVRAYRERAIKEGEMPNRNPTPQPGPSPAPAPQPAPTPSPIAVYRDPVTQQEVHHAFLSYFMRFGSIVEGVEFFGRPLTAEMRDVCEDGHERTVQFFERAVYEWHGDPGDPSPGGVMLRRLGAYALHRRGKADAQESGSGRPIW